MIDEKKKSLARKKEKKYKKKLKHEPFNLNQLKKEIYRLQQQMKHNAKYIISNDSKIDLCHQKQYQNKDQYIKSTVFVFTNNEGDDHYKA